MTTDASGGTSWVRPPAGDMAEVNIHVPYGKQLDPGLTAAIDAVITALQQSDEAGTAHPSMMCDKKGSCQPMSSGPCYELVSCRIV